MCLCLYDNLKTIADIFFMLGSYVDWRKFSEEFAFQDCRSSSRSCFRGFSKVMSYSVARSEIPSPIVSFSG